MSISSIRVLSPGSCQQHRVCVSLTVNDQQVIDARRSVTPGSD